MYGLLINFKFGEKNEFWKELDKFLKIGDKNRDLGWR